MPKPAHTRFSWSGVFGSIANPLEEWNFNLNMGEVVFTNDAARQTAVDAARTAYSTHLAPLMFNTVHLTETRIAQIGADGKTTLDAGGEYNQALNITPVTGGSTSTLRYPLSVALCVSLETQRSGPKGKGRFYLPFPARALDAATYRLATATATEIATAAGAFVQAVDNTVDSSAGPNAVVSVVSSYGFVSGVTAVKVGTVPDTQRRRRGDMDEGYVRVAVAQ